MNPATISILLVALATLTCGPLAQAGAVRLSFLDNAASLEETIGILTNNGCGQEGTTAFRSMVQSYYAEDFLLDRSKFPKNENGFYSFPATGDLVKALPHRLCDTKHSWVFNCMDAVIVPAQGKLQAGIGPDDHFGPFMAYVLVTNEQEAVQLAATARDAYFKMEAPWHRALMAAMPPIVPDSMKDNRMVLTAELLRWHLLPDSTTNATVKEETWSALRSDWNRAGLRFPDKFQIVLYHRADVAGHHLLTHHAGLLFSRGAAFTYLEKAGGQGPFVRLDFEDKRDLSPWFSAVFTEKEHRNCALFVTLNDKEILGVAAK